MYLFCNTYAFTLLPGYFQGPYMHRKHYVFVPAVEVFLPFASYLLAVCPEKNCTTYLHVHVEIPGQGGTREMYLK